MPELPECRIMSDFIRSNVDGRKFKTIYSVEKGNVPNLIFSNGFDISSSSRGKEIILKILGNDFEFPIHIFMGMSGNWKWLKTEEWNKTKFVRLRFDTIDNWSLILYGGYMGPKFSFGKPFVGTKRGPDPMDEFDQFQKNILNNIHRKLFDKPICEVLLNQEYFNGIGNYIRSTILYYLDCNPFESARNIIQNNPELIDLCRQVPQKSYHLNGGQLKDWKNPYDIDSEEFSKWVFYQKGLSCKDSTGRTFWFQEKWKDVCPYKINNLT